MNSLTKKSEKKANNTAETEEVKDKNCKECEECNKCEETENASAKENKSDEFEQKYNELEDKYFRLAAEYSNFQRRTKEEKEALYTNAVSDTVGELLPILDNLQRAVDTANDAADVKTVAQGVSLVSKMALEIFEKLGVEPIEAVGKKFDASLHNAVMHVEDDSFGENEVVEEFQKGYKCKDRVIRYSMVKVAN